MFHNYILDGGYVILKTITKLLFLCLILLSVSLGYIKSYAAPKVMSDGGIFDAEYYASQNPDVVEVIGSNPEALYNHYLTMGSEEGRLPYNPTDDVSKLVAEEELKDSITDTSHVVLLDSGYSFLKLHGNTYIYYGVKIWNPNSSKTIRFPVITVTARADNGTILATDNWTIAGITPNDTIICGNSITCKGTEPSTVEISVSNKTSSSFLVDGEMYGIADTDTFIITNFSQQEDYFTGDITNASGMYQKSVCINVVFKSGTTITGAAIGFANDIEAGETIPFKVIWPSSYYLPHDSYEVHVMSW